MTQTHFKHNKTLKENKRETLVIVAAQKMIQLAKLVSTVALVKQKTLIKYCENF